MSSHLNLVGSIAIGGLLLFAILNMNLDMTSETRGLRFENMVRENTASIAEIINYDFRRMGFGVNDPNDVIQSFSQSSITFLSEITGDGVVDTIAYSLSNVSDAHATPNPNDRYIYRKLNKGSPDIIGVGVTDFRLIYYDRNRVVTNVKISIAIIEIQLTVESTIGNIIGNSTRYAQNYWQTRIAPPNLIK